MGYRDEGVEIQNLDELIVALEYLTVYGTPKGDGELDKRINFLLSEGWRLWGNPYPVGDRTKDKQPIIAQAMLRTKVIECES